MKLKHLFILVSVTLFSLAMTWLYMREIKRVSSFGPTAWEEDHRADCAVVLTGGPGRVREGFDLLAREAVQKLIISGVHPYASLREIFPQWPFYGNINERDVVLERRSETTYGNAQQSLPLVEALHCRSLVLITSTLHMYRAQRTFRNVFPPDFPIVYRAILSGRYKPGFQDLAIEATKSIFYSIWAYQSPDMPRSQ